MTGRTQERLISAIASSHEIHFFGHQEFLTGVLGLFQLQDPLPQLLPSGKTQTRMNDNAK